MKIFLMNGPPQCGKDTIARQLPWPHLAFADPLRHGMYGILGLDKLTHDEYEEAKRTVQDPLEMNMRELMIWLSEEAMKPKFGKDIFGKLIIEKLKSMRNDGIAAAVMVDAGFNDEKDYVVQEFGKDSVILVRIHRVGCDFTNDSRSYLAPNGCQVIDVYNNEYIGDVVSKTMNEMSNFLEVTNG
jgi:hypothetical protein